MDGKICPFLLLNSYASAACQHSKKYCNSTYTLFNVALNFKLNVACLNIIPNYPFFGNPCYNMSIVFVVCKAGDENLYCGVYVKAMNLFPCHDISYGFGVSHRGLCNFIWTPRRDRTHRTSWIGGNAR